MTDSQALSSLAHFAADRREHEVFVAEFHPNIVPGNTACTQSST